MSEKKERPILFSGPMVKAILEGRKTQTRRVVKRDTDAPVDEPYEVDPAHPNGPWFSCATDGTASIVFCPYGTSGCRLWVREAWAIRDCGRRVSLASEAWPEGWPLKRLQYVATDKAPTKESYWWNSRSPIHMPRWASRLTLEITDVRVGRLTEISQQDIAAEGFRAYSANMHLQEIARTDFAAGWDKINGKRKGCDWNSNPWVFVISFRKV